MNPPTNPSSNTNYLQEFMDRMFLVPNDVNRFLRMIRNLDKRVQKLQAELEPQETKFLVQFRQWKETTQGKDRKGLNNESPSLSPGLQKEYDLIVAKQTEMYGYQVEKAQIAQQLSELVSKYHMQLETELKSRSLNGNRAEEEKKEGSLPQSSRRNGTGSSVAFNKAQDKGGSRQSQQQVTYSENEPTFCYCRMGSFGTMVACENPFCERQWFHTNCLDEKHLPQKWYCNECQRQKDKTKNSHMKSYFNNPESV